MVLARGFSCDQCAAAPVLQALQGCLKEAPRVFARYAKHDYTRCPLAYHRPRAMRLVGMVRQGAPRLATAKGAAAWRYTEFLMRLEEAEARGN